MKTLILAFFALSAASSQADVLRCKTAPGQGDVPAITLSAEAGDHSIENVTIAVRNENGLEKKGPMQLFADENYRPRGKNKNFFRFGIRDLELLWGENGEGYLHYVFLPNNAYELRGKFKGMVGFSTDAYHDGIVSYAWLNCDAR